MICLYLYVKNVDLVEYLIKKIQYNDVRSTTDSIESEFFF